MAIHPNNTPDPTTTAPAVHVDKLSFRYGFLDDDPQPKRTAAAPAAEPLEQANAIEDISFSLPSGKLRHEKPWTNLQARCINVFKKVLER